MAVVLFEDARDFQRTVTPVLQESEAENTLLLGLIDLLARRWPERCLYNDQPALMAAVIDDQEHGVVRGAALMTPPHRLILSRLPGEALTQLIAKIGATGVTVPGINGPEPVGQDFAARWQSATGRTASLQRGLLIYQLDQLAPLALRPRSSGALRVAVAADLPLLTPWSEDFDRATASTSRRQLAQLVAGGQVVIWQSPAGEPQAMAAWLARTRTGVRIGNVYTPPALRGQGFGSAVVAALSQQLLTAGRRFCFLYTESSNPTANHIYQVIGYRVVCSCQEWLLS